MEDRMCRGVDSKVFKYFGMWAVLVFALVLGAGAEETVFRRPMERVASMDPLRAASVCESRAISVVY